MTNMLSTGCRQQSSDTRTTDQVEHTFIFTYNSAKAGRYLNVEVAK